MTAVDHAELKRLAEGAMTVRRDANGRLDGEDAIRLWVGFHDAMTPQVALELLSEIEGLKAERDRLKLAICGGEDVPGSINAVSVDDCERFIREEPSRHDWSAEQHAELDSHRTQAPDSWRPDREVVARIVDPMAWRTLDDRGADFARFIGVTTEQSLAKADAILALRPQTAESGK